MNEFIVSRVEMEAILRDSPIGFLGMALEGEPYVVPLNFAYVEGNLLFHCALEGKKLDVLAANPKVYTAAITIAIVATLETLLNLEAVDKLDSQKRVSPANRELLAQGMGNMVTGLIGGLPVTSVIVRSSVNISSGGKTKLATI